MFEFKSKASSVADIDKLWNNYKEVQNWKKWDSSIESIELLGNFKKGTKGTLKSVGMPPLEFQLTSVTEKKSFSNESEMGPFLVTFSHNIEIENDVIIVEHGVIVSGPDENKVNEIGNDIASTIPNAMTKLLEISK
ncbi:hypothetical protein FL866_13345 [Listeria monocytogenes]|nr:hypothetical protein [Listeria monocytogenes]ECB9705983.1 hypothetical protein [Listeria monocytogenes]ECB9830369.1 hypothetical protein [Listeria monocytogenes]